MGFRSALATLAAAPVLFIALILALPTPAAKAKRASVPLSPPSAGVAASSAEWILRGSIQGRRARLGNRGGPIPGRFHLEIDDVRLE
jgi:hypothetical protein